jgi:hypothetical protein
VVDERTLHGVQLLAARQALDGHHIAPVRPRGQDQAPVHSAAVKQDGAGAALAVVAALLGARQIEVLAQQIQQRHARIDVFELSVDAVDAKAEVEVIGKLGRSHKLP